MDLRKINAKSLMPLQRKQTQRLKELLPNIAYRVLSAEVTGGLYGEQVILHLQDHSVYLANRVAAVYKQNLEHFFTQKYSLVYLGEVDCGLTEPMQSFKIVEN
nr:unnamed protein product [Callosobruchus analis]